MNNFPRHSALAAAVALAVLHMGNAIAQDAKQDKANDGLQLDSVVVTATTTKVSKMKQSVSVSGLNADQVLQQGSTNAAEALRTIPGVRSEASAGEGNTNITVRGVPISDGGSRYVQIQENGLPVLMFGDMLFITSDSFLRADGSLDYIEAVRGGSASTLASNSPGGVINFIEKTGETEGGFVALTSGLGFKNIRTDFSLGKHLAPDLRFHVGGFYRQGELPRDVDFPTEEGGQLKLNVTKDLPNGYLRGYVKVLSDQTATLLPHPVDNSSGTVRALPGYDPRKVFLIPKGLGEDIVQREDGSFVSTNPRDGFKVNYNAVGLEADLDVGNGFRLSEKFRVASADGRFIGMVGDSQARAAQAGSTYATGALRGQAYRGQITDGLLLNTELRDQGNVFNDVKLSKTFVLAEGSKTTGGVGVFYGQQTDSQVWGWNQYSLSVEGSPELINQPGNINGTSLQARNIARFAWDIDFQMISPYASVTHEVGPWLLDASVRQDNLDVTGYKNLSNPNDGIFKAGTREAIDYSQDDIGYSFGANYQFTKDLAVFARTSLGYTFPSNRTVFVTPNPRDGSTSPKYQVEQTEVGVKYRNGGFSSFATLFTADTSEATFDPIANGGRGLLRDNEYTANGLEVEGSYKLGNFRISSGFTYTDAEITASNNPATVGNTPNRQADLVYQISPSYSLGKHAFGVSLIGSSDAFTSDTNRIKMDGYNILNSFYTYQIDHRTSATVSVNNLTDELAFTEANNGPARAFTGRSGRVTLKYAF